MDVYVALCVFLCAVSGSSPASLRIPRQTWPDSSMEHFHFPDRSDEFSNDVFGFPDMMMMTRPGGRDDFGFPGFGPRPTGRPSGGQIPDFSNNPWLNGINTPRPSGGNNQWSNGGNNQWSNGGNNQWSNGGNNQRPSGGNNQWSNGGNNQWSNSGNTQRPTTTTTTERTSTPRTYHLAPEGCDCPFTPQFNPVCGSDGNTYKNEGLLNCFRLCGIDVSQRRMGAC